MTENIKASIKHEVSLSMKEGNKFRTTTLRLMVSAFQVEEINKKSSNKAGINFLWVRSPLAPKIIKHCGGITLSCRKPNLRGLLKVEGILLIFYS